MKKWKENFLSFRITCLQNSAIVITTLDKCLYTQCNRRNRPQKYKLSLHYYMMFGCQQNLINYRCGGWHQRWRNTMALFSVAYNSMSPTTFRTFSEFYRFVSYNRHVIWRKGEKICPKNDTTQKTHFSNFWHRFFFLIFMPPFVQMLHILQVSRFWIFLSSLKLMEHSAMFSDLKLFSQEVKREFFYTQFCPQFVCICPLYLVRENEFSRSLAFNQIWMNINDINGKQRIVNFRCFNRTKLLRNGILMLFIFPSRPSTLKGFLSIFFLAIFPSNVLDVKRIGEKSWCRFNYKKKEGGKKTRTRKKRERKKPMWWAKWSARDVD